MKAVSLPKWPQTFELIPGSKKQFAFPILSAGKITVHLDWKNSLLDLTLMTPGGKQIPLLQHQSPSSVDLEYEATEEDVHQGSVWIASVTALPNGHEPRGKVTGHIKLDTPTINTKVQTKLNKDLQIYAEYVDKYSKQLEEILEILRNPLPTPIISRVVPDHALPGEIVTVYGENFVDVIENNEVNFNLNNHIEFGTITSVAINATTEDSLKVTVPYIEPLTVNTAGTVLIHRIQPWEADSAPRKFTFDAETPPNIALVTPFQGDVSTSITIRGSGFGTDLNKVKVFFNLPNDAPQEGIIRSLTDSMITTEVPDYFAQGQAVGTISVKRHYPRLWLEGVSAAFIFRSTQPIISHYYSWNPNLPEYKNIGSTSVSPKGWLCIEGEGFTNTVGSVQFNPLAGQNPGDRIIWYSNRHMNIIDWNDSQILAAIPDDEYFPFDGEFFVEVTRPSGQFLRTSKQSFKVVPTYDHQYISFGNYSTAYVDVGMPTAWAGGALPNDYWEHLGNGIMVFHGTDFWSGRNGTDTFFRNTLLKNYWVVESVNVNVLTDSNKTEAHITESHSNSGNPTVKVCWSNSVDPFPPPWYQQHALMYTVSIRLRGPKGYEYS